MAVSNQTVRQDYANYQEALAEVRVARSGAVSDDRRDRFGHPLSARRRATSAIVRSAAACGNFQRSTTRVRSKASASWVPDLWGEVRRTIESSSRDRPGQRSDACQCDVVRADRARQRGHRPARDAMRTSICCTRTVEADQQALRVVADQDRAGTVPPSDLVTAQHPARHRAVEPDRAWRRPRPERTRDRRAGRQESRRAGLAAQSDAAGAAFDSGRRAVDAAAAPAGHRHRRTPDGRAERRDRRRGGGVLPDDFAVGAGRLYAVAVIGLAACCQSGLVAGRLGERDDLRWRRAQCTGRRGAGELRRGCGELSRDRA